jgi:hypothetical protein
MCLPPFFLLPSFSQYYPFILVCIFTSPYKYLIGEFELLTIMAMIYQVFPMSIICPALSFNIDINPLKFYSLCIEKL